MLTRLEEIIGGMKRKSGFRIRAPARLRKDDPGMQKSHKGRFSVEGSREQAPVEHEAAAVSWDSPLSHFGSSTNCQKQLMAFTASEKFSNPIGFTMYALTPRS
jgi:hypothetical protein